MNSFPKNKTILPIKSDQELLKFRYKAFLLVCKDAYLSKMARRFQSETFKSKESSLHIIPFNRVMVRAYIILPALSITLQV